MKATYFETIITPNDFLDTFSSFILDSTNEAIEFATIKDNFQFNSFNLESNLDSTNESIIIRTQFAPDEIIENIKNFSLVLTKRLNKQIGFLYYVRELENKDWIESYKNSITPLEIGEFYIRPSWCSSKENKKNIIIDPALAFGSGHHASTFMCIELLQTINLKNQNLADIGCGSGILGIVSSILGANVVACDVDELAVEETKKNFLLNDLEAKNIFLGSINSSKESSQEPIFLDSSLDVICANIIADIIIYLKNDFKRVLKQNGILIISGIIEEKLPLVLDVFSDFTLLESKRKDEWVALKLQKI